MPKLEFSISTNVCNLSRVPGFAVHSARREHSTHPSQGVSTTPISSVVCYCWRLPTFHGQTPLCARLEPVQACPKGSAGRSNLGERFEVKATDGVAKYVIDVLDFQDPEKVH